MLIVDTHRLTCTEVLGGYLLCPALRERGSPDAMCMCLAIFNAKEDVTQARIHKVRRLLLPGLQALDRLYHGSLDMANNQVVSLDRAARLAISAHIPN